MYGKQTVVMVIVMVGRYNGCIRVVRVIMSVGNDRWRRLYIIVMCMSMMMIVIIAWGWAMRMLIRMVVMITC